MTQTTEIAFTDQYGDERRIRRNSEGYHLVRPRLTPVQVLSQELSALVGSRIRAKREERGYTLAELCSRAGLVSATPKQRMWQIENAKRREGVTLGTIYALALALDVEPCELMPSLADARTIASPTVIKQTTVTLTPR